MSKEEKTILQRALEAANEDRENKGDDPYDIVSYSGRAMYGKKCLGVKVKNGSIGPLVADIAKHGAAILNNDEDNGTSTSPRAYQDFYRHFSSMTSDSLGLGMIVYFTSAKYVETDDIDEDGEDVEDDVDWGRDDDYDAEFIPRDW